MKVRPQSFTVFDDYFKKGLISEQIERCGRVCYKSEEKISEGSAQAFIKGIIQRGHESVLEMGNIVLDVKVDGESAIQKFFAVIPRFLRADRLDKGHYIISGNPRSFRDLARGHSNLKVTKAILGTLSERYPILYEDLSPRHGWIRQDGITVTILAPEEIDALPMELLLEHRTILCHMITNRAVTHELVRHRVASYLQESQRYCRYDQEKFGCEVEYIMPCFYDEGTQEYLLWKAAMEDAEKIYLELLKTSSPQAARTVLPNSCKTEIMVHTHLGEWVHIFRLRSSKAADPSMRELMLMMLPEFVNLFPRIFEPLVTHAD
jgi:thymidylate synthase (FAD)